jgi:hypothetical protein
VAKKVFMPKQFYTERDIEDLFSSGTRSLQVTDDVVLTELAYEKAKHLGLQLSMERADTPPAAPIRPYIANGNSANQTNRTVAPVAPALSAHTPTTPGEPSRNILPVEQRIRSAVIARLGNQVDAKLLDNIIHRVVKGIGLK